jgi:hypothetical protein
VQTPRQTTAASAWPFGPLTPQQQAQRARLERALRAGALLPFRPAGVLA